MRGGRHCVRLRLAIHLSDQGERAAEFLRLARARERPSDTVVFKLADPPPAD